MKLITERTQIRDVLARWEAQYPANSISVRPDQKSIRDRLAQLNLETATKEDLKAIIGNDSWSDVGSCDECGKEATALVVIGQEPDYESHTASVCQSCVQKALNAF